MTPKKEKIELRCNYILKRDLHRLRLQMGTQTLSATVRLLLEQAVTSGITSSQAVAGLALRDIALHLDRVASALQRLTLSLHSPEIEEALSRTLMQVESLSQRAKDLLPPKR